MRTKRYRFIASNLHVGGGVQVGASLIDEMAALAEEPQWRELIACTDFEVSSAVARNADSASLARLCCSVVDRRPGNLRSRLKDIRQSASSIVVFGPIYSLPRSAHRVMGYADVTSIYPPVTGRLSARSRLRRWLSRTEVAFQHDVVVETDAMADRLHDVLGAQLPRVHVVPNTVNRAFFDAPEDTVLSNRLTRLRAHDELLLAYPTRPYPHKNLGFLPRVANELMLLGTRVRFVVTLTDGEMASLPQDVAAVCANLGELNIEQMGTLMRGADGVFFPSLLEAYSATPLEALASGTPLYASDRDFVRSVCGDAAVYFDPLDPRSAAAAVLESVQDAVGRERRRIRGRQIASSIPGPRSRAERLLTLLDPNAGLERHAGQEL